MVLGPENLDQIQQDVSERKMKEKLRGINRTTQRYADDFTGCSRFYSCCYNILRDITLY